MEKRDRIFGVTTKELVPYLEKVRWLKGDRPAYRHEKYVAKALKSLTIPPDTAIVFTTEKRHPFSMAEIAQGEEEIKGKKQVIYGIFIHEFSVGYLEAIYRQLLAFIPYLEKKDMENVVVAFIQKVLLHELGHRAYWRGMPLKSSSGISDADEYAEIYAYENLAALYDEEFLKDFLIFNYAVAQDYMCNS